ncbi:CinA family protein [Salinactinospora qingdaonensis]|uniref:CinA family protein n=1 Tax=Salinactinospora qingdaonensis TaxID=702744 RepID=A0ABP7G9K8_9ACTN
MAEISDAARAAATLLHRLLRERSATVATAESLTGGLIGAALTDIPGASVTYRGGVVCYATDVKESLLGVHHDLLHRHGAVHPDVAIQLALGARELLAATYGLAVTGVAGPDPQDGWPVGTVFLGFASPEGTGATELPLGGSRAQIRRVTTEQALRLLSARVARSTSE